MVRIAVVALLEYLLGFLALAVFAAYAFGAGPPSDARWIAAFKLGGALAAIELAVLLRRADPANRLILGANLWLMLGGAAALLQQWWWLQAYQRVGEAGLFVCMLLVGAVATLASPAGFVAQAGDPRRVLRASWVLILCVTAALGCALAFRGDVKLAAVAPVITLSWVGRALRRYVRRGTPGRG